MSKKKDAGPATAAVVTWTDPDRAMVCELAQAIIYLNEQQSAALHRLQGAALSDGHDGSHEFNEYARLGRRKLRYANALIALLPFPTGKNGEAIGKVDAL